MINHQRHRELWDKAIFVQALVIAIPPVIIGELYSRSKEKQGRERAFLPTLPFIFLIWLLVLIASYIIFMPWNHESGREMARCVSCKSNLNLIGRSLVSYSIDNDGYFPPYNGAKGLELLRKYGYRSDSGCYICPVSNCNRAKSGEALTEDSVSYNYNGGYQNNLDESQEVVILCYDKSSNHIGTRNNRVKNTINVLYSNGLVLQLSVERK